MDMHLIYLSVMSSSIKPVLEGGVVTDPKLLLTTIWLPAIVFHIPLDGGSAGGRDIPLSGSNLDPLHHIPATSTVR